LRKWMWSIVLSLILETALNLRIEFQLQMTTTLEAQRL
jgi:hypothetical protein